MEHTSVILAIETSQREGSVALRDKAGRLHVETLHSNRHGDDLMRGIDDVVKRAGIARREIGVVAVSIGPGGFTGLRIAVTTAKMLAFALGSKIVAVPSALVAAQATSGLPSPALIVLASKADRAWCTEVRRSSEGGWSIHGEPGLRSAQEICWSSLRAAAMDQFAPPGFTVAANSHGIPIFEPRFRAEACFIIGSRLFDLGAASDPDRFTPLYARPPDAKPRVRPVPPISQTPSDSPDATSRE